MTKSEVRVLGRLGSSSDVRRLVTAWTVLALLALIMEYGPVRVCPKWGTCEKGPLCTGGFPLVATLLVWVAGIAVLRQRPRAPVARTAGVEERSPSGRSSQGTAFLTCALVALVAGHLFLLSPPIPHPFWAYPVRLSKHLGFPLNWDSPVMMDTALDPDKLLHAGPANLPQNRPLYIWIVAGLTKALAPLARVTGADVLYGVRHSAFLPGIAVNWGLLTVALFLFWRLISDPGGRFAKYAVFLFAVPLLANDIVKAFFWTLHMQFFNLLVPLLGVWICRRILGGSVLSLRDALLMGLGLGASSLAYESFLFILPAVATALVLRARPTEARNRWLRALLLGIGFAIPNLVWMGIILDRTGGFTRAPFQTDRDFVWVADALAKGAGETLTRSFSYLVLFLRTTWSACGLLIVVGVLLLFVRYGLELPLSSVKRARGVTQQAAAVTLGWALVLLYLMGQYLERYSFFVAPILLVLCGLWLTEILEVARRTLRVALYGALAAADVFWLIFQVAKYGPYS